MPYIEVDDIELMRFVELFRKRRDEHLNENEEEEYFTLLIKIVRGF
jgi:hypothetical protein